MKIHDGLPLKGHLSIYADYLNGERVKLFSDKNLIITSAKAALLSFLYNSSATPDPIQTLRVGTGGSIDPEGFFPKEENPDQLSLTSQQASLVTTYSTEIGQNKVTFLADLPTSMLNGVMITEAGLFKQSGGMFNLKNHPGIPKTNDFAIHYEWEIEIP